MNETIERETETLSYRTMTRNDAIDLRIERIRDLERDHYRLALVAEENGGVLSAAQDGQRLDIERRIAHQVEIVWPDESTPHSHAPDHPDGPPAPPGEVNTEQAGPRGAVRESPTFADLADLAALGAPLRDDEHTHHASHGDGDPVEDDPELADGAPLGDVEGGASHGDPMTPWSGEPGTSDDEFRYNRVSGQYDPDGDAALPRELSRLQRISHFPSEHDRRPAE